MAKVGYARVSSVGQSLDVQREKLADCDKLFEEKRCGTTDARVQLKECLNYVREGDQLVVTRIDRLARSTLHLCQIAETLRKKGVDLVVLDQNIDTSDATGRLLFTCLGLLANSRPRSAPSAKWTASKEPKIAASNLASDRRLLTTRSQNFVDNATKAA